MRLSQWIDVYKQILEREGDLEVEGHDGMLLRRVDIVTRTRRSVEDRERQPEIPQAPAGGKE
jgi:hypothetical protein